jgi:cell division protein FtsI/penicillin-binding protein 2
MWPIPRGFKIAGKTGTAQIPVSGHYDPNKVVSSFVGFAPAYDPKFVMLVSLKDPQIGQYASPNAGFIWFNIASDLLPHLGAQPN